MMCVFYAVLLAMGFCFSTQGSSAVKAESKHTPRVGFLAERVRVGHSWVALICPKDVYSRNAVDLQVPLPRSGFVHGLLFFCQNHTRLRIVPGSVALFVCLLLSDEGVLTTGMLSAFLALQAHSGSIYEVTLTAPVYGLFTLTPEKSWENLPGKL